MNNWTWLVIGLLLVAGAFIIQQNLPADAVSGVYVANMPEELKTNLNLTITMTNASFGVIQEGIWNASPISWDKIDKSGSSLEDLEVRSASALNSGTLSDARLSSNVPLKDAENAFTAAQTISVGSAANALMINHNVDQDAVQINNNANMVGEYAVRIDSDPACDTTVDACAGVRIDAGSAKGLHVYRNAHKDYTITGVAEIIQDNPNDDQRALLLIQNGGASALEIGVSNQPYAYGIWAYGGAGAWNTNYFRAIAGEYTADFYRNLETSSPLVRIYNDNAADTQPALTILHDGDTGAASGALFLATSNANNDNAIYHSSGARLSQAGAWINAPSYSHMKEAQSVDFDILEKFRSLNVSAWKWKNMSICRDFETTDINGSKKTEKICTNNYASDPNVHYGAFLDDMAEVFQMQSDGVNVQDWVGINQLAIKKIIEKLDALEAKINAICSKHPEISECRT